MPVIEDIIHSDDALIVVDVQIDFCPGGALPIPDGDKVIPVLNSWIDTALMKNAPVLVSRDWHPKVHCSFSEYGGSWPAHCIQDSEGARFHPSLQIPESAIKITKGVRFDQDQNSVFEHTGLADFLRKNAIKRIFVGGLAEDVCVLASVLDGIKEKFEVTVITAATRPTTPHKGEQARNNMLKAGAQLMQAT